MYLNFSKTCYVVIFNMQYIVFTRLVKLESIWIKIVRDPIKLKKSNQIRPNLKKSNQNKVKFKIQSIGINKRRTDKNRAFIPILSAPTQTQK